MSDLICKNTMSRCLTPGTCSPHGGCRETEPVSSVWLEQLRSEFRAAARERDRLKAENETLQRERTDWQAECLKKGFEYVRESDDHYVLADVPEMAELLGHLLGVEVRDKDNHSYGETVSSLNEQIDAANNAFHRAYELEKEVEKLKARDALHIQQFNDLSEFRQRTVDSYDRKVSALEAEVEALRKDSGRYQWIRATGYRDVDSDEWSGEGKAMDEFVDEQIGEAT